MIDDIDRLEMILHLDADISVLGLAPTFYVTHHSYLAPWRMFDLGLITNSMTT